VIAVVVFLVVLLVTLVTWYVLLKRRLSRQARSYLTMQRDLDQQVKWQKRR